MYGLQPRRIYKLIDLVSDNAQALCAYETVALGFSHWCGIFTYEEWEGFEYSLDIGFAAGTGFQSPIGRAIGIGTPLSSPHSSSHNSKLIHPANSPPNF